MNHTFLLNTLKSAATISKFVTGSGLREAISDIVGDIHLEAAKLALETSKVSLKPEDRINSAITHLEAAHASYIKALEKFVASKYRMHRDQTMDDLACKNAWVCCLIFLCYLYLEDRMAAKVWLARGREGFRLHHLAVETPTDLDAMLFLPSIIGWFVYGGSFDKIDEEGYDEFVYTVEEKFQLR